VEEPAATVGVLALQGDVLEHESAFAEVGVATRRVRRPADLDGIDGLVLPGGESTTLSMLLESSGLFGPIAHRIAAGLPTFGTCAGLILLAKRVEDGRGDQRSFCALDCAVRRNGYGPQRFSFEAVVEPLGGALDAGTGPLPAVFIRAPLVTEVADDVEILATEALQAPGGRPAPVVLRQGRVLGVTFHPELTGDRRLQRLFAEMVERRKRETDLPPPPAANGSSARWPAGEAVAARR
jgi:pyridoxal 5'-phosphate synthase pdxT subunit